MNTQESEIKPYLRTAQPMRDALGMPRTELYDHLFEDGIRRQSHIVSVATNKRDPAQSFYLVGFPPQPGPADEIARKLAEALLETCFRFRMPIQPVIMKCNGIVMSFLMDADYRRLSSAVMHFCDAMGMDGRGILEDIHMQSAMRAPNGNQHFIDGLKEIGEKAEELTNRLNGIGSMLSQIISSK